MRRYFLHFLNKYFNYNKMNGECKMFDGKWGKFHFELNETVPLYDDTRFVAMTQYLIGTFIKAN